MSLLLHISDTHFGTEDPPVVAALQRLAATLRPDVLVLSGDITQRARRHQFAAARAFCDSLGIARILALPGNHDIPLFNLPARVLDPYGGYRAAFGADLEPELDGEDLLLLGVNTTRPARHKHGEVSKAQVARVARRLESARREQLRVVVTHQPACVMREEDEHDRLRGGHAAVQAWSRAGADLVLGGHIHLPYLTDACARVPDTPRALFCLQAGTALSLRVRHGSPNSVNVVRWTPPADHAPRECRVERWDYELAQDRFDCSHAHALRLAD
ncbi:metallophosphoesterase [Ramlibacter sp.]|uniref:metallophosphoesterase family protein n=1 Tax=Ramlibacter sp. TaxID=1917967 RepID=UPI002D480756|nr:metallophosphoesterase [Ramlibacter sp.]HYD77994.1 metallophosphoesterase [Ramlibacter sp.]